MSYHTVTISARSSVDRALVSEAKGRAFDPRRAQGHTLNTQIK